FAAELGRMVAAVPGSVVSPLSEAPNDLLYDGACMVRNADDILELLFGPLIRKQPTMKLLPPGLSPELQAVADAIGGDAVNVALLGIELPDLEPSDLMARLGQLELQGVALRDEAGYYRLA
ncbi:MAG: hypothetical protein JHC87_10175, partial [Thermoleophilaceae bacterium]|nr:hypothetical protein [Thermoleophilaceae bacterium]